MTTTCHLVTTTCHLNVQQSHPHYGRLNGLMSAPVVVVMALAPWAGTALSNWTGSYAHAYLVLGAIALVAALVAVATVPSRGT